MRARLRPLCARTTSLLLRGTWRRSYTRGLRAGDGSFLPSLPTLPTRWSSSRTLALVERKGRVRNNERRGEAAAAAAAAAAVEAAPPLKGKCHIHQTERGGMAVECFSLATMRTVGGKGGHTNNTTAPLPQQQCSNATVVQQTVQKLPYALRRRSSRATSTFLFPPPFSSVQRDASSSLHLPLPPHFPNIITAHRR